MARAPRAPARRRRRGDELVAALRDLYAYTYGADPAAVVAAAELRAEAMDVSDAWVAAGCDPADPRLAAGARAARALLRRAARRGAPLTAWARRRARDAVDCRAWNIATSAAPACASPRSRSAP